MSITRRSLLKAIGVAPAVAAGVATVEPVAAEVVETEPALNYGQETGFVRTIRTTASGTTVTYSCADEAVTETSATTLWLRL